VSRSARVLAVLLASLTLAGSVTACSAIGGKKSSAESTSVFNVKPGECFQAPTEVKSELSSLSRTPCSVAHTQESYAIVKYAPAANASTSASAFPGEDVLTNFAQGVCAQQFTGYVGVDYLDSKLYFTYLLPSARGWEQSDDRNVVCFVTTTGATLTRSVKDSKQ
jgi:Septum formation